MFDKFDTIRKVHSDGSSIVVCRRGGHVMSWKDSRGRESFYLSPTADPSLPIRGGIPIIFPQFSNLGPLPAHGIARVRMWVEEPTSENGVLAMKMTVGPDDKDAGLGLHVRLHLIVRFSNSNLTVLLRVENLSKTPTAPLQAAFHTYLRVSDISSVRLEGFSTTPYRDNLKKRVEMPPQQTSEICGPVDRLYGGITGALVLCDNAERRRVVIRGINAPDAVLWNPWSGSSMKDLPKDDYKKFVCVEHGAVLSPQSVGADAWVIGQEFEVTFGDSTSKL